MTIDTLARAAAAMAANDDEAAAALRLLGQLTDEQLWDLGTALMAISVGHSGTRAEQSIPGARVTSNGSRLSAVTGAA